jgi:transcriptional regulator with XRE-family HTH domain
MLPLSHKNLKNMAIGNNIRKLRIEKNFSQQFVADNLHIDRRTYAAWEQDIQEVKSRFFRC